jgi:trimethylamine--corrinoid protein Co-methyltransferase
MTVREQAQSKRAKVVWPGIEGGAIKPLSDRELERINEGALQVLERVGMADAGPEVIEIARKKGLAITDDDRILFSRAYIEDMLAGAARNFTLYGRERKYDLDLSGSKVHFGTAGAAISVPDPKTGKYRPSTLCDEYDFARLADRLPNIHWFGRTVVPTEMKGGLDMDVNITYALAAGTAKHVGAGFTTGEGIEAAAKIFDMILGGEGRFAEQPCCSLYCTGIVPPLRYGEASVEAATAAVRVGMPVDMIIAAQAGATAPAALAGALVQTTAEGLGGVALVNLLKPGHPTIFSNWPRGAAKRGLRTDLQLLRSAERMRGQHDRLEGPGQSSGRRKGPHRADDRDVGREHDPRVRGYAGELARLQLRGDGDRFGDARLRAAHPPRYRGERRNPLDRTDRGGRQRPRALPRQRADAGSDG